MVMVIIHYGANLNSVHRNGGSKKASKTKSRSNKKGAPPTCERSELDDISVIELEENATLGNATPGTCMYL